MTFFQQSLATVYAANCRAAGVKPNSSLLKTLPSEKGAAADVTVLDVSRNFIGPSGANALIATAEGMPCLRILNLQDNQIGNATVDVLCRHMKTHPTLNEIYLGRNPISLAGGKALLYLASYNSRIITLELEGTLLNAALKQRIAAQVQLNLAMWKPSAQVTEVVFSVGENGAVDGSSTAETDPQASNKKLSTAANKSSPPSVPRAALAVGDGVALLWAAMESTVAESEMAASKHEEIKKQAVAESDEVIEKMRRKKKHVDAVPHPLDAAVAPAVLSLDCFEPLLVVLRLTQP